MKKKRWGVKLWFVRNIILKLHIKPIIRIETW